MDCLRLRFAGVYEAIRRNEPFRQRQDWIPNFELEPCIGSRVCPRHEQPRVNANIKMAKEETDEPEDGKSSGGKSKMIMWIVMIVMAIGGGVATPVVIAKIMAPPSAEDLATEDAEPDPEEEVEFIEFGEVTVNLSESRFSKFLRMKFSLQVPKSEKANIEKQITAKKIVFQNWIQVHLSDKSVEDLKGRFGRNQVRREMLDFFNKYLFEDGIERIQDVLFEEFQVQ